MQVGGHAERRVPAVADVLHAEIIGQPGDLALFGDAANLGHVRLHDVECAPDDPGDERLPPRQHLAAGDRHGAGAAQGSRSRPARRACSASSNQPTS